MDFKTLSRKELQALCKSNGIPANKTNAFMAEALVKKRVPLSQVDANRGQRLGKPPILSPVKSPPPAKKSTANVTGVDPTKKPPLPLFTNNFLKRGKRKDPPVSIESEQRVGAAATVKSVKTDTAAQPTMRPDPPLSTQAKADSGVKAVNLTVCSVSAKEVKVERRGPKCETNSEFSTSKDSKNIPTTASASSDSSCGDVRGGSKGLIDDRVRSQINAALCSKVMKAPDRRPPEREAGSDCRVDRDEAASLPPEQPQQQKGTVKGKVEYNAGGGEVPALPLTSPEREIECFPSPDPPALQILASSETQQPAFTAAAVQRVAALDVVAVSPSPPPITFSPLMQRVSEKIQSMKERMENFWKRSDLVVVNSFGSPVQ